MIESDIYRIIGWTAIINAAANLFGFSALILFFIVGGFWGPLNDVLSVIFALSLIPIAVFFYRAVRPDYSLLDPLFTGIGITAMMVFAVLQFLLVVRVVRYEQTLNAVMALTGVIGLWALIFGLLAIASKALPGGLGWWMAAFGGGLIISAVCFRFLGQQHPLTAAGFFLGNIAGVVWAIGLAQALLTNRVHGIAW